MTPAALSRVRFGLARIRPEHAPQARLVQLHSFKKNNCHGNMSTTEHLRNSSPECVHAMMMRCVQLRNINMHTWRQCYMYSTVRPARTCSSIDIHVPTSALVYIFHEGYVYDLSAVSMPRLSLKRSQRRGS